jgi:spore maturation protein CgeB
MANFSCNNTHQFNLVENISPHFDFNLHSEKDADSKFKAIGANPVWFPMAANPKYYYPSKSKLEYDVSFVGAAYAKRAYYVNFLINHQIGVDCFGPNWLINLPYAKLKKVKKEMERIYNLTRLLFTFNPDIRFKISSAINNYDLLNSLRHRNPGHFHYPLSDREMISVYNKSKINLGFLEVFTQISEFSETTKQHLHLREFEVPMCGGLFLTNYMQELEEFYELEKEIITFRSEYELADKIRFYLNNEKAAAGIRKAAYLRAMNLHTYQRRFKDLFKKLSL